MLRLLLGFALLAGTHLDCDSTQLTSKIVKVENYDYDQNPYITSEERDALKDYLLPEDHKVRPLLDAIFYTTRATATKKSLLNAGFEILSDQPRSYIIVAKHPSVPGYIFKLHLDDDKRKKGHKPGWYWFSKRIYLVRKISKCIQDHNFTKYFKTPNKWVYPLPIEPSPPYSSHYERKNFILVEDDMHLVSETKNEAFWKNEVTYKQLDQLKVIIEECGGGSLRPRNLPLCKDGKIAFIDTEYPEKKAKYYQLSPYLNHKTRSYWKKITD